MSGDELRQFVNYAWKRQTIEERAEALEALDALLAENGQLREALAEDREKWSFDTLLFVADRILERDYGESVFPRSDSDEGDPGPVFLRRLRDARDRCREALQEHA